jgi:putative chitinase
MITDKHLALIAPHCPIPTRRLVLPFLNETLQRFEINTVTRVAAFLGNVLVESGEFHYTAEIWGNTPAQQRYDVGRKAIELGNTPEADGDGKMHKGFGWIQTTGKKNQDKVLKYFGLDVNKPEVLGQYPYCALSAGYFWKTNQLNRLADLLDGGWDASEDRTFRTIVRRVNGGQMHIDLRIEYYRRALFVLTNVPGFNPQPVAPAPAASRPATPVAEENPPTAPAKDPNPIAENVGAPTIAPAGTVSNDSLETRLQHTALMDFAAQQVPPGAAKTFGKSLAARSTGPLARAGACGLAALQAGHWGAWLVAIVVVVALVYFVVKYRRNLMLYGIAFYHKAQGRIFGDE